MPRSPRKPSPPVGRRGRPARETATVTEAKLFMNGRSQAVRLPVEYRFAGDSVYVKRWRGAVILLPKRHPWAPLIESLGTFSSDFMRDRAQPATAERPGLDALFD
jgi:antitoxin VapB